MTLIFKHHGVFASGLIGFHNDLASRLTGFYNDRLLPPGTPVYFQLQVL